MNKLFSYNDFVSKFDVVTNNYMSSHQEIHRFLDILGNEPLDEKYEFVFPLFYDFKISNNEVYFLPKATCEPYEWLIRESVKKQVEEHTKYRVGITESYCKSDIEPSYLEIKQSNDPKTIDVKIEPYKDHQFCKTYLMLSPSMVADKLEIKEVEEYRKQKWDLDGINAESSDPYSKKVLNLHGLEKGVIAHYPIIKDGQRVLYYFFTNNLKVSDEKKSGFGGLFVIAKEELKDPELGFFMLAGYTLANKVALGQIQHSVCIEAIKSAIAAIMSRNMSHNLGSHYLYYTKTQLVALADSIEEKGPEIRGAAKVMGYMQARMDYLATIVAGEKYPYGSVYFKGQIFDELTIDDFSKRHFSDVIENGRNKKYKRTTNYLLQNLILSENFTREPVVENLQYKNGNENKTIRLQVMIDGELFTGILCNQANEERNKLKLAKICMALPGGIMSIHAFYNVLENLIRNSAKYRKEDFHGNDLVFTIAVNELDENKSKGLPCCYEFTIFDNKANAFTLIKGKDKMAKSLLETMMDKLRTLKILNENNVLDKGDKGLKEMLFSTIWMRAYTYENTDGRTKDLSDILMEIDSKFGDDKLAEIKDHGFEYIAVDDNGKPTTGGNANLGIRFCLPKFRTMEYLGEILSEDDLIRKGLNNFRDIVCMKPNSNQIIFSRDKKREYDIKKVFTRVYDGVMNGMTEVDVFKSILQKRFGDIDIYKISIEKQEKGFEKLEEEEKRKYGILFLTHLGLDDEHKKEHLSKMRNHFYSEAISGENFTKTMQELLRKGMDNNKKFTESTQYFALKVKEAALTRITLIDERFYKNMIAHSMQPKDENPSSKDYVFKCKNIRILTLNDIDEQDSLIDDSDLVKKTFIGNDFRDGKNHTHFLSIHLGMIEKIVKDDKWSSTFGLTDKDIGERAVKLLEKFKDLFKSDKGEIFVSIHSGRGNFSKELEDSLKEYPFISVSALDAVLSNCKFLLAQMFYNTVYIGKGVANGTA